MYNPHKKTRTFAKGSDNKKWRMSVRKSQKRRDVWQRSSGKGAGYAETLRNLYPPTAVAEAKAETLWGTCCEITRPFTRKGSKKGGDRRQPDGDQVGDRQ
jgi:hypothetical protein